MKLTNTTYSSGFTLIELLIAVLIIGVLAAVAVPQYQQAVLKSRYKTLMLPTKSINSGNEVYYLSHGYYADRLKELDVDFNSEDERTLVRLSDDLEYAYVLSTRSDIDNNYIMYQKHSMNYPGEIHCEALTDDEKANKLCKILGGEEIAGSQTSGYTTYVLEGTGHGVAPGVNGEGAKECEKAIAMGYSCEITKNDDGTQQKKVCQTAADGSKYCTVSEYSKDGDKTKRTTCLVDESTGVCKTKYEYTYDVNGNITSLRSSCNTWNSDGTCSEYSSGWDYTYDNNGNQTSYRQCSANINSDGTCSKYGFGYDYTYDDNGNQTSQRVCTGWNSDGTCSKYSSSTDYTYDANGKKTSERLCIGWNSDGTCSKYTSGTDYTYDANGNQTSFRQCAGSSNITSDGTCKSYSSGTDYTYDVEGNKTSERICSRGNVRSDGTCSYGSGYDYTYDTNGNQTNARLCVSFNSDSTCSAYSMSTDYTYDANGNQTSFRSCTSWNSDGTCGTDSYGEAYTYDANGNKTSSHSCSSWNSDGTCKSYSSGTNYTYDTNGNLTSQRSCRSYSDDGTCDSYSYGTDYTYDEDGNKTSEYSCYNWSGTTCTEWHYTYTIYG